MILFIPSMMKMPPSSLHVLASWCPWSRWHKADLVAIGILHKKTFFSVFIDTMRPGSCAFKTSGALCECGVAVARCRKRSEARGSRYKVGSEYLTVPSTGRLRARISPCGHWYTRTTTSTCKVAA